MSMDLISTHSDHQTLTLKLDRSAGKPEIKGRFGYLSSREVSLINLKLQPREIFSDLITPA